MYFSRDEESPLEWLRMLEEIRTISERCQDRLAQLRRQFPLDLPENAAEFQASEVLRSKAPEGSHSAYLSDELRAT